MGIRSGICAKCGGPHSGNHSSYCAPCYREFRRSRRPFEDKERKRARQLVETRSNPEKYAAKMRRLRDENPEKYKEYFRLYRKKNPEKVREWNKRKKAKRYNPRVGSTPIKRFRWIEICHSYGNKCFYCGKSDCKLVIDHAIPLSRGGTHDEENLRPACWSCNGAKWARTPEEFYEYREKRKSEQSGNSDTHRGVQAGREALQA